MLTSAAPAARHKTTTARRQKFPPLKPLYFCPLAEKIKSNKNNQRQGSDI